MKTDIFTGQPSSERGKSTQGVSDLVHFKKSSVPPWSREPSRLLTLSEFAIEPSDENFFVDRLTLSDISRHVIEPPPIIEQASRMI